jgi:hypothetical protein
MLIGQWFLRSVFDAHPFSMGDNPRLKVAIGVFKWPVRHSVYADRRVVAIIYDSIDSGPALVD